jgi:hypothetical protein
VGPNRIGSGVQFGIVFYSTFICTLSELTNVGYCIMNVRPCVDILGTTGLALLAAQCL